jgi:hypothetical protein
MGQRQRANRIWIAAYDRQSAATSPDERWRQEAEGSSQTRRFPDSAGNALLPLIDHQVSIIEAKPIPSEKRRFGTGRDDDRGLRPRTRPTRRGQLDTSLSSRRAHKQKNRWFRRCLTETLQENPEHSSTPSDFNHQTLSGWQRQYLNANLRCEQIECVLLIDVRREAVIVQQHDATRH